MLASRMDWILCLFYSSRSNSAETLALQSLLLRFVESQETRRQLCGGKLLLRIWLAPDEAAKIFKFCIRLEVYVWAYITVRCRKNASLCPTNGSPWGALFGINSQPTSDHWIISSKCCDSPLLLPDTGSIPQRTWSAIQLGATGGISPIPLLRRSRALQEVYLADGAAIRALVRLQQHCIMAWFERKSGHVMIPNWFQRFRAEGHS